jgi:hypothetical protein
MDFSEALAAWAEAHDVNAHTTTVEELAADIPR